MSRPPVVPLPGAAPPIPRPTFASRPFWEAVASGRLLLQRCDRCEHMQYPPKAVCEECHGDVLDWADSSGGGILYSFTVVRRPAVAAFADAVPYVIALVDLDEGPRLMTNLLGEAAANPVIGMRLVADLAAVDESGTGLVYFSAAPAAG